MKFIKYLITILFFTFLTTTQSFCAFPNDDQRLCLGDKPFSPESQTPHTPQEQVGQKRKLPPKLQFKKNKKIRISSQTSLPTPQSPYVSPPASQQLPTSPTAPYQEPTPLLIPSNATPTTPLSERFFQKLLEQNPQRLMSILITKLVNQSSTTFSGEFLDQLIDKLIASASDEFLDQLIEQLFATYSAPGLLEKLVNNLIRHRTHEFTAAFISELIQSPQSGSLLDKVMNKLLGCVPEELIRAILKNYKE